MPNPNRYYPPSHDQPSTTEALRQHTDALYDLREQLEGVRTQMASHRALLASHAKRMDDHERQPPFTTDLAGIKINATTDPLSLQDGWSPKYDAKTGQFVFKP